jgi:2-polyprenyl-3-methyl-5-hydroxy-6-metoxy-1,4-benzoquinol methylase
VNIEIAVDEVICPSCARQGKCIGVSFDQEVYKCTGCKLCYLKKSVRTNSDNDNHWYQGLSDNADVSAKLARKYKTEMGDCYRSQYLILEKLIEGRKIVDVGCGLGVFLAIGVERGWDVYGVESSEYAAPFALNNYGIQYAQRLDALPNNSFDIVRISHVLEHIPEPREFLDKLYLLLRSKGILAVMVPNREPFCATFVNKFRSFFTSEPRLSGAIYPDMHVLGFCPNSLTRLVTQSGFEAVNIFTVSMGNKVYFPMFYDGLLTCNHLKDINLRSLIKYYLPMTVDNIGNPLGKGQWIVAYFRRK